MKIIQITAAVEEGLENEATVFGLGDDGMPYYWGVETSKLIEHEPDEDGNTHYYEKTYNWIMCGN